MSWQIVKQPDGKYAIWSTCVDDFIVTDGTKEEITQVFVDDAKDRVAANVNHIITELEQGGKPYYQFTKTFEELEQYRDEIHGSGQEA